MLVTGNEANADIFVESITLKDTNSYNGIWIESRTAPIGHGQDEVAGFEIFARTDAPYTSIEKLRAVRNFLLGAYSTVCELPTITGISDVKYTHITLQPTSNIQNIGTDSEGRVVFSLSGQVSYKEEAI